MTNANKATAGDGSGAAEEDRLLRLARQRQRMFTRDEWLEFRTEFLDRDPSDDATRLSTWAQPVSLAEALQGGEAPTPTVGTWKGDDGTTHALFYANEIHSVFGEPESMKSWLVLMTSVQEIKRAHHVFYFDMESNEHSIVARLQALDVRAEAIRQFFHYFKPDGRIDPSVWLRWDALVARHRPTLVVLDGVSEAFATQDKDINATADTAQWFRLFARRFLVDPAVTGYPGPAVVEIDHVVKSRDDRGRWAIGSQHKMAGIKGAAYMVETIQPLSRGTAGHSRLLCEKDSAGGVVWTRTKKRERFVGTLHADATDARGSIDIWIEPPSADEVSTEADPKTPLAESTEFRFLMHEVWKFIVNNPSCSGRIVRDSVTASNQKVASALEFLERDGYIRNEAAGVKQKWVAVEGMEFEPLRIKPTQGGGS